jgi:hypothetical protein
MTVDVRRNFSHDIEGISISTIHYLISLSPTPDRLGESHTANGGSSATCTKLEFEISRAFVRAARYSPAPSHREPCNQLRMVSLRSLLPAHLRGVQNEKRRKRGGFEKGLMLTRTTTPHSIQQAKSTGNDFLLQMEVPELPAIDQAWICPESQSSDARTYVKLTTNLRNFSPLPPTLSDLVS